MKIYYIHLRDLHCPQSGRLSNLLVSRAMYWNIFMSLLQNGTDLAFIYDYSFLVVAPLIEWITLVKINIGSQREGEGKYTQRLLYTYSLPEYDLVG